ncbi:hypothetical protein F5888DRAFT_1796319 [Russula emetica]|nr:hypothetical protein F5888DRAFT_1796319 [Russula emetica]
MSVGNLMHQSSVPPSPTDLSDFVNMDLFTTQSSTTSGSREPSPSISTPLFSPLPIISESNPSDWFNFSLEEDFVKTDHSTPPPVTGGPWDFLTLSNDSPDSGSTATGSGLSPSFAIDPQLMSSSVPPVSSHDLVEMKDLAVKMREEEDEEEETITNPLVKVGGKGKSRKGVVQSGGIQKKAPVSAVVRDKDEPRDDGDDWRPSPEEYKKMSSKEKRQLRNKISARNFRVRRKEYITTLEGDIAERDRLIDAIRTELGSSQSENAALRQEIGALKKALLASAGRGRAESPALPPPGPIPAPATRTSSSLVTPNTQKDLPSSPRLAASPAKAFWGGSASFGGVTPVHTTLIPENFAQPLASVKSLARARAYSHILQENINPLLNLGNPGLPANAFASLSKATPSDSYADANPLSMKMLDAYRMQLRSRFAQYPPTQSQLQSSPTASHPQYFPSPHAPTSSVSSVLSGKHTSSYPSPPSSPKLGPTTPPFTPANELPTPQQALLASMASQTLLQQLGSAFWQAFMTQLPSNGASPNDGTPTWDTDKIRRVLEGKAVVSVVDVEPEVDVRASPVSPPTHTLPNDATTQESSKGCGLRAVLEESMCALSLSKE